MSSFWFVKDLWMWQNWMLYTRMCSTKLANRLMTGCFPTSHHSDFHKIIRPFAAFSDVRGNKEELGSREMMIVE